MIFDAQRCAAIVTEHGGVLDHATALAAELGIPCVAGCRGAWSLLEDGDDTWVDGETGAVVRLSRQILSG
jgi:pyruvate,water dikinase